MRTQRFLQAGYLLALLSLAACASQGEGERCDRTNANDDCESGLRCTQHPSGGAICCPEDRAPNEDICRTANSGSTGGKGSGGRTSSGGSSSGGSSSGGSSSGGAGGMATDASPGMPPEGGIDGAPQSG